MGKLINSTSSCIIFGMKVLILLSLIALVGCSTQSPQSAQITAATQTTPQTTYPSGPPPQPVCPQVHSEFLVTQNSLYSEKVRHIEAYLTPTAFNERNLRDFFACLSKENPEPEHLIVKLETDWTRVHIPDGMPGSGASNMPPDPQENDFLRAIYFRRPGGGDRTAKEYFRYSPRTHVDEFDFTTVIIKK